MNRKMRMETPLVSGPAPRALILGVGRRPWPVALFALIAATMLLAGCSRFHARDQAPVIDYLASPVFEGMDLPFSGATRVGDLIFVSGNLGNPPGQLELVPGGIEAETRQTLENIKALLERHGSSLGRVVKVTVMMTDMSEWPKMNEVYKEYFTPPYPARSALGANGLALGARVEIECIAVAD